MAKKVTQQKIADVLKLSQPTVSFMLTGEHGITLQRATFLKKKLGIPFDVWLKKDAQEKFFGKIYLKEDKITSHL